MLVLSRKIKHKFAPYISNIMNSSNLVAVCQITSTNDKEKNLNVVKKLTQEAAENKAKFIFFPEAADYIAVNKDESKILSEKIDGYVVNSYRSIAKKNNIWMSIGGFHERYEAEGEIKAFNSHIVIDDHGEIRAIYRKLHLFDVSIPEQNINLMESAYNNKGFRIVPPVSTPVGNLGLAICYDLRFPEMGIILRKQGAQILTYPSAFTVGTGKAHWEVLLRARAVENQCYVIASAQYGQHNSKRVSYGYSVIINPWGEIISQASPYSTEKVSDETIIYGSIDLGTIEKVRKEMPVFDHRRDDIYVLNEMKNDNIGNHDYKFADKTIPASTVFYRSKHCFAFTNIRCVVPGHVLVSTLREAARIEDLTNEEISDMFITVAKVQKIMEMVHNTKSSTICVQDGKNAGQTVPHVHCHILPRKGNEFSRNDDVYDMLAKHDQDDSPIPLRKLEDQVNEAANLRKMFV